MARDGSGFGIACDDWITAREVKKVSAGGGFYLLSVDDDLLKMSCRVAWTSNGVVSFFKFDLKFLYSSGYISLNLSGKTKLKNGRRSSCLPCRVFRMSANL